MDSRRAAAGAVGQGALLLCGIGMTLAWRHGLYACAAVLALLALWLGAATVWGAPPARDRRAPTAVTPVAGFEDRLLSGVFDQIPAPLLMLEADGTVKAGNRAARRLFDTDDRVRTPPPALLHAFHQRPRDGRRTVNLSTETEPRTYAMSMIDLAGAASGRRLALMLDIQPEIRAAEATALRELMQVLSHEIMNALTPVASLAATAVDLLAEDDRASTQIARDAVETLARRAEGLGRFVEAYRTLARLPPPVLGPTSVFALFEETARLFRGRWSAEGVVLSVAPPRPDIIANLDMDLMVHALTNILSNGAEAALEAAARPAQVYLTAECREGGVTLSIHDSGAGVAPADRERIFQPFFTTKANGTGVGLSFARQVALGHGGTLSLLPDGPDGPARFELSF